MYSGNWKVVFVNIIVRKYSMVNCKIYDLLFILDLSMSLSWNFTMKLYSDEGLSLHYFETLYLSNPGIIKYCQKVDLSETQLIEHKILYRKFNFLTKDGRIQLQIKHMNLWCNSQRICLFILTKRVSGVVVTDFSFVFQRNKSLDRNWLWVL